MIEVVAWLLVLADPFAVDRRAACLERNRDAPGRYRPIVQALCADHHNLGGVGASVAVVEGGALRFVATAGERCVGGAPVEVDTGFRVGSLTKLLTAALALRSVDVGEWTLDEPVVRMLPELGGGVDPRAATISLRQLLSHSAGLSELWPRDAPAGPETWISEIAERPLGTSPGTLWSYSNVGYALAGAALERSSGEPYPALLQRRLLAPLGATHVTADVEVALRDGAACGHLGRGARVMPLDVRDDLELGANGARWAAPAGGVVASSGALAVLALALFDPLRSPLSARSREALLDPQIATHERPGEAYGLGVRVQTLADGSRLYGHGGATGDFAAELYFVPARGFALVLLSNTGDPLQATATLALQVLLGVQRGLPGPPGALRSYAGSFVATDGDAVAVAVADEALTISWPERGFAGARLEHAGDRRFRVRGVPDSTLTFVFTEDARYLRAPDFVGAARE